MINLYAQDIEATVLSSILNDNENYVNYICSLKPEYFSGVRQEIIEIIKKEKTTDISVISNILKEKYKICILTQCLEYSSSKELDKLIEKLIDYYNRRKLYVFCNTLKQKLIEDKEHNAIYLYEHTKKNIELEQNNINIYSVSDVLKTATINYYEKTIETGIDKLQLIEKEYCIIAARPSMGKTSLALTIANNFLQQNIPVLFISLESSKEIIIKRLLAIHYNIPYEQVTFNKNFNLPFYITDIAGLDIINIKSFCRFAKNKYGVKLLILDHLGLIKTFNHKDNRHIQLSYISKQLLEIIRENEFYSIILHQLSRACEMRNPPIPKLSDLRESGSLEEDADKVVFLYREGYYDKDKNPEETQCIIAKNRNGKTGYIDIKFNLSQMKFTNKETKENIW